MRHESYGHRTIDIAVCERALRVYSLTAFRKPFCGGYRYKHVSWTLEIVFFTLQSFLLFCIKRSYSRVLKVSRRFGERIASIFRVEKEAEQETRMKAGCKRLCLPLAVSLVIVGPFRWKRCVPPKRWWTFNGLLHCVVSQKIVLFITTAVRTSNPT
jgi:hypothetical protein